MKKKTFFKKNKDLLKSIVIVLIVLVFVCGGSFLVSELLNNNSNELFEEEQLEILETAKKESKSIKKSEMKDFEEISVDTYLEKLKSDEVSIILVGRPTCSACKIAEPILKHLSYLNNLTIYYINIDNFNGDDEDNFFASNKYFENGFGTPLLLVVQSNQFLDKISGVTTIKEYTRFFKNNNFIEK